MPDSKPCLDARASLDEIRSLRSEFESAYAGAASYGNPEGAERAAVLKREIETKVAALREAIPIREAEHLFDLRRQYDSQTSLLRRTGLVQAEMEKDGSGAERETLFMTGIDGKKYPMPSYETVARRIAERRELLGIKADQGFVKLLLVPFGMSLSVMFDKLWSYMLEFKASNGITGKWSPVGGDHDLRGKDASGRLLYDNVSFRGSSGGLSKGDILRHQDAGGDTAAGWRMLLLQAGRGGRGFKGIPRKGAGTSVGTVRPRPDIETGRTPAEFLAHQQAASAREESPYFGESGMSPEEWIVLFLAHLEETGKLLDDPLTNTESIAYLTGAYIITNYVPFVHSTGYSAKFGTEDPYAHPEQHMGARFAVRV